MDIKNNSLGVLTFLSFYAPLIITISILLTSIFTTSLGKGLYFLFWVLVISFFRMLILYNFNDRTLNVDILEACNVGGILPFSTPTYSTFILSFTLAYLLLPTYLLQRQTNIDTVNYILMLFLVSYITLDIFVKSSIGCITKGSTVISELLGGIGLGSLISLITYFSSIKNNLFITELTNNNEICSMPSKQRFKCRVYQNGELVSTSMG
jgi:hypothetical protein